MKGFTPGLFDRLMDTHILAGAGGTVARMSIENLKNTVRLDIEALLNTRAIIFESMITDFPECAKSILTYGLNDFASLSLSNSDDLAYVCRCLENAIARHEPRLQKVRASIEVTPDAINRLNFTITAELVVNEVREGVNFDAILQPSSLSYKISRARSATRAGA